MNPITKTLQSIRAAWNAVPGRDGWANYPLLGTNVEQCEVRGLSSVYAATTLLSGLMGSLPHRVVRSLPAGGLEVIENSPVALALNDWDFTRREQTFLDMVLNGNGYLRKVYRDGELYRFEVLDAGRMTLLVDEDKAVFYRIDGDGFYDIEQRTFPASDIVHFKMRVGGGYGEHGLLGVSPLVACSASMALVGHINIGTRSYYKNVAVPSGVLQTEMKMGPEEVNTLRARWKEHTSGKNSGGTPILTHGLQWKQGGGSRSAIDNALSEISRVSVLEVCRMYQTPAALLQETSSLNYSTAIEQHRSFGAMTLVPLAKRISDTLTHALLPRDKRTAGYRIDLDTSSLMIGSGKDRAEFYAVLLSNGVMSADEVRAKFNMAPGAPNQVDPQQNSKDILRLIQGGRS